MILAQSRLHDGWLLRLTLPPEVEGLRDELLHLVVRAARGHEVAPLRRSRHATTFNVRFSARGSRFSLYVKAIDAPAGFRRIRRIFRSGPAMHAARIAQRLQEVGLGAPSAWICGRELATRRELIVTPRAPGNGPLRTLAEAARSPQQKWALMRALGREVSRLHRAGFVHGDLTPFNIFVVAGEPPRFIFLDHERTRHRFFGAGRRPQLRNLVQLGRFKLPYLNARDRLRFLAAYCADMGYAHPREHVRRVNAMLQKRLERDGGFQTIPPVTGFGRQ
ncbi:MAG TPA: lipopolysaccharide kinase InaA family protein [Candidatus Binataceae bacterium]|nr:lipopolysaccharide kinase InaA family protein [Candidatus Binataceae bacterium]